MRDNMAVAINPPVQRRQPPRKNKKRPDSFHEAETVVTRNPLLDRDKFLRLLILTEKPMPTPGKKTDKDTRYIKDLGRRIEEAERVKKLPDLSEHMREVA